MSINYSTPHRVDVPVVGSDDSDDDILFNEQNGNVPHGDIDDLDFDPSSSISWIRKIKQFFNKDYTQIESYELYDTTNLNNFEINDDGDEENIQKINRLKRKHYRGFAFLITTLIVLVTMYSLKSTSNSNGYGMFVQKAVVPNGTMDFYPTTIVVSLDGFHPHYISEHLTPALHKLMVNEYGAPYMIPSFPSSTFPNHWTLVTGLYPSEHGIVGNTFYDPKLKKQFINTNPKVGGLDPDFWHGGQPIWETAGLQNVKSAVHMWPGSEVPGIGIDNGPLEVDRYNGLELLSEKVKRVMGWLDRKDIATRPELILTYVPTIDSYGHKYGISGPNLTDALTYVDDFVGLMIKELDSRNLNEIVNLIILSDHGMAPTSNDRLLYLDDIVDMDKIEHIDGWPLFGLRPYSDQSVEEIYEALKTNVEKLDENTRNNFDIYKVEDLPKEWNFGGNISEHTFNYRLAPLWIIPHVGYAITTHKQMEQNNNDYSPKGVHGYNNTELLMRALFLGTGPYFRSKLLNGKKVEPFPNTEVYNLICESLNLVPSPNNGTFSSGYISSPISESHLLDESWSDPLVYPNLDFEVSHIVDQATYDLLWKFDNKPSPVTVDKNPDYSESLVAQESSLPVNVRPSLPKPSDFSQDSMPTLGEHKGDTGDSGSESESEQESYGEMLDDLLDQLSDIESDVEDSLGDFADSIKHGAADIGKGFRKGWDKLGHALSGEKSDTE